MHGLGEQARHGTQVIERPGTREHAVAGDGRRGDVALHETNHGVVTVDQECVLDTAGARRDPDQCRSTDARHDGGHEAPVLAAFRPGCDENSIAGQGRAQADVVECARDLLGDDLVLRAAARGSLLHQFSEALHEFVRMGLRHGDCAGGRRDRRPRHEVDGWPPLLPVPPIDDRAVGTQLGTRRIGAGLETRDALVRRPERVCDHGRAEPLPVRRVVGLGHPEDRVVVDDDLSRPVAGRSKGSAALAAQ